RPVRCFMGAPRARLYRRKFDLDAETFCQRIDRVGPDSLQIISLRIEGRDGLGAQLERTPDDEDIWICVFELTEGRLRQPAERSDVIREYFQRYRFHSLF